MVSTRDKIVGSGLLVIGASLMVAAFRVDVVLQRISMFALSSTLSAVLAIVGVYHLATARDRAERVSHQLADAPPRRRLWLPARLYTYRSLLWQSRALGSMVLFGAVMGALVAFLAYRHGL